MNFVYLFISKGSETEKALTLSSLSKCLQKTGLGMVPARGLYLYLYLPHE